ncbi:hypothetical protein BKA82DRAFT_4014887 [Pisolithus tinctorius]|nr:hypothetical protein BKA82DRAFT_4014887 [Pisolithus tinctorius]
MLEWCPWKATVQRVLGIPHPLNLDGQKAGNSVINAKYTKGAACEIWVTQISSNSCWNGVHGKPLLNGQKAGNSLVNGTYIPGAAYGWKAGNSLINGTYIQGAACEVWVTQISSDSCQNGFHGKLLLNVQKAGNSVINAKYTKGAACELQFMPEWFPWKATVEWVPGMLHPYRWADGWQ